MWGEKWKELTRVTYLNKTVMKVKPNEAGKHAGIPF